jgi:glycosyltransferase involved in cell wall biosynthesis
VTVEFPEYAFAVSEEHAALYRERVVRGRQRMRASRVVIAGLVRNAIDVLPATIERVERLCAAFADFRVVVYENDSIDGTRELLAAWAAGVSKVTAVSDVLSSPVNPKTRCNERGERMADCRNRYRDLVAQQFSDFDHVIVIDLDVPGGWSEDGIANTFGWDDWDFVGANGIILQRVHLRFNTWLHYDAWAFREQGSFEPMPAPLVNNFSWRRGEPLVPVYSCFGGLGIYRMPAFLSAIYAGGDCEHVALHRGMRSAGFDRLFLNPSQLVFYGRKVKTLEGVVRLYNGVRSAYSGERLPA